MDVTFCCRQTQLQINKIINQKVQNYKITCLAMRRSAVSLRDLDLAMKTTQTKSVLLSSLSYKLKNVGLKVRASTIAYSQAFPLVFKYRSHPHYTTDM